MRRLGAPLRVAWDWSRPPVARGGGAPVRADRDTRLAVGAEIVRAQVLLLEIGYPGAGEVLAGEPATCLQGFAGSLELVLDADAAEALDPEKARGRLGPAAVWLDATPVPGNRAPRRRTWPARRYHVTAANVDAVAELVLADLEDRVEALSFPVLPLAGALLREAAALCPGRERLQAFAARIAPALQERPEVELRVHHYGLAELLRAAGVDLGDDGDPARHGCQAGEALAYIDPGGAIYPCAALPVPLGRAAEPGGIARAWAGEAVAILRERIGSLPRICADCPARSSCAGGCRGWARFLGESWESVGPDCTQG